MKTILCYGDSNTWGYIANSFDEERYYMERYPRHIRWPGILQNILGDHYYVIEEGLNSRTTNVDYQDLPGRNGKSFLPICLHTHAPLDLVILMLGMNDLKSEFKRSAEDVTQGLNELIRIIQTSTFGSDMQLPPKVLLIGYPVPSREDGYADGVFANSIERAKQFDHHFNQLANKTNCYYFNAAPHINLSELDGIHFDEKAHATFGKLVANEVNTILL